MSIITGITIMAMATRITGKKSFIRHNLLWNMYRNALILSALLPLTGISYAQQPTHQGPMSGDMMGMEHGMGTMDPAKLTEHLKKRQEQMLLIHDLSNKILAEKDPQRQQALKDQQLELMKAHHMEMMSMHHGKPMNQEKKQ